jgi:hypothetical protein
METSGQRNARDKEAIDRIAAFNRFIFGPDTIVVDAVGPGPEKLIPIPPERPPDEST